MCTTDPFSPVSSCSTETSFASDASSSCESIEQNQRTAVCEFMQHHVCNLFDPLVEISLIDKQKFGELCQTNDGRELFAKYVNKQRCVLKQVDETTFYKLAHSFALVLFECSEADDFGPSKTLMNMSFTFYHIPESASIQLHVENEVFELPTPDSEFVENYAHELSDSSEGEADSKRESKKFTFSFQKKQSNNKEKNFVSKAVNDWFKKEFVPFFQPNNSRKSLAETKINKSEPSLLSSKLENDQVSNRPYYITKPVEENQSKVYLYQVLRRQAIWKSIRFWNAAFFDSLNSERQRQFASKGGWNSLSEEERASVNLAIQNATFGQLGTFIYNMKYLGLGEKTCMEFLRKQSIIGNIGKELYQILKLQVETPLHLANLN